MKIHEYIGKTFESNNFGRFKVLDFDTTSIRAKLRKSVYFKIQFENTGSINYASYDAIKHGRVKDKYAPVIAGVGYIGSFEGKVSYPDVIHYYSAWNDMLHRCYDKSDRDYPYYGALGVRVDPRWFDFGNYFNDIQQLPGFHLKCRYPDMYQLDKDYLQLHLPKSERVYSKDTCIWLSKFDNTIIMNFDNGNDIGYFGVLYKDHSYIARINNRFYGRYTDPIAAANAARNIYNMANINNKFNNITLPINFPIMSAEETVKYLKNPKIMCVTVDK